MSRKQSKAKAGSSHYQEPLFTVEPEKPGDDVIDKDLILVWTERERRIITGSDLLGRLLRKIARDERASQSGLGTRAVLKDTYASRPHSVSP